MIDSREKAYLAGNEVYRRNQDKKLLALYKGRPVYLITIDELWERIDLHDLACNVADGKFAFDEKCYYAIIAPSWQGIDGAFKDVACLVISWGSMVAQYRVIGTIHVDFTKEVPEVVSNIALMTAKGIAEYYPRLDTGVSPRIPVNPVAKQPIKSQVKAPQETELDNAKILEDAFAEGKRTLQAMCECEALEGPEALKWPD